MRGGLGRPPSPDGGSGSAGIGQHDPRGAGAGDWTGGSTGETSVVEGAVWPRLNAVKGGQAKAVNDDVWFLGLGPTGAQLILKDLRDVLVDS